MSGRAVTLAGLLCAIAATAPSTAQRAYVEPGSPVWIDAGWFLRGSNDADLRFAVQLCRRDGSLQDFELCTGGLMAQVLAAETPQRRIHIGAFGIDRTEVTRASWQRCVDAGRCPPPRVGDSARLLADPNMPVTGIDFHEAQSYCAFAGGRLPTESEWERAARGSDGRRFPWGWQYNDRLANHASAIDGFRYLAPVASFPRGASPHGLVDMAGNVWEWTSDHYDPMSYRSGLDVDPRGSTSGGERVVRGGSWRSAAFELRVTTRGARAAGSSGADLGVRCAYDRR